LQKPEAQFRTDRDPAQNVYRPKRAAAHAAAVVGADKRGVDGASQMASEKLRRPRNDVSRRNAWIRRWVIWMMGGCIAMSGFVLVLWLTAPVAPPMAPGLTLLTNATVSDVTSLMAAVQTAGLSGTSDVKGAIEEIKRLDAERVTIKGWVADATASGASQAIVAFAGGHHALTTAAGDARFDITRTFSSSDQSATNMSFQGGFACRSGEKLIVVAVTSDRRYSQFRTLVCP
jgi:hypothetical protein